MGGKNSKSRNNSAMDDSKVQNLARVSRISPIDQAKKLENERKKAREEKEKEFCDIISKKTKQITKPKIKNKIAKKLASAVKKNPWDELEKTTSAKVLDISSCDLSNPKAFEKFSSLLKRFTDLEELNFSDCNLTEIPKEIPKSLKKLELQQNMITELKFLALPCLEYLDISYNKIKAVPKSLGCNNIKYLNLHNNCISTVTDEFFQELNYLKTLDLSGNQIVKLDFSISSVIGLRTLNLNFNQIDLINNNFFSQSTSLTVLSIKNNPLIQLHSKIELMESLVKLDLRSTKLTELPSSLCKLKDLEHLFLDKVNLEYPPMYVVKKGFDDIIKYLRDHPKEQQDNEYCNFSKSATIKNDITINESPEKVPHFNMAPSNSYFSIGKKNMMKKNILEKHSYIKFNQLINEIKIDKKDFTDSVL